MLMILLKRLRPQKVIRMTKKLCECSEIPDSLLSSFTVEDAKLDVEPDADEGQLFDYGNVGMRREKQRVRSFLNSENSESDLSDSSDNPVHYSNESEPIEEPETNIDAVIDLTIETPHRENDENINGHENGEADKLNEPNESNGSIISIGDDDGGDGGNSNHDKNRNVIQEIVQELPKCNEIITNNIMQKTNRAKRKSTTIDVPKGKYTMNGGKKHKLIEYLSSSSESGSINLDLGTNEKLDDIASNGTLSIYSSSSSEIHPY